MATSEETDGGISAAPTGAIVGREKDVGQMEAPGSTKNAGAAAENGNLATSEGTLASNGHAAVDLKMDEPENDVEGDDEGEDDDDDDDDDEDGEDEDDDEEDPAQNLRRLVADDDDEDDDDEDEFEPGEVDDDEDDDIDDEVDESFDVGQEQAQGSSGVKRTADESFEDESRAKKARSAGQQPAKSAGTAVEKLQQQVPKPPSKVDSLLSSLTKKQPTTTVLDASRRNWQSMKEQNPNLKEDVEEHLKSKDSYLSKQAFLNRGTDQPASTGTAAALGPRRPE